MQDREHYCNDIGNFPLGKFLQVGTDKGSKILIVGESPAPNGWRKSGKAFYTVEGKLLPTGKNLNLLLRDSGLSVETCGFTELVKCFVGKDRHLLKTCGEKCWSIFTSQLKVHNFTFLILLGVKTTELFNLYAKTNLIIGSLGKIKIEDHTYTVLPLYHPSPISPIGYKNNVKIFEANREEIKKLIK